MKRFNFERYDGEDDFDEDDSDDMEEGQNDNPDQVVDAQLIALQVEQNFLLEQEINEKLLVDSINLCSSGFFWRYTSHKKKLEIIQETYKSLRKMLEEN